MTESCSDENAKLTPTKRALLEIRELRTRLAEAEKVLNEPIAVVGIGLRLPGGVRDSETFARLLWSGSDAVKEIPVDRWSLDAFYDENPDAVGKMITRYGAFIDDVDEFDAEFFGISPREAASMDPQQRLMLEVAWEALEDAGHSPSSLDGSRTGVYVGVANNDYGRALFSNTEAIDAYVSTGNAYSVVAGRLSYFLGLHGPSIAVDTACSSSLVAIHLACQALRLGECDLALSGGVNVILTPEMNINFSKAKMMAPDGRCKVFDAAADGYVRGEGCATVVLRRLSDALADGDRILALIRGSAVNQDGRSSGLTAPNGPAQEAVIRAALKSAQVEPKSINFVETHGTGTPLGDPIEVGALGAVFSNGRDAGHPLIVGSVKSNIGHLEAAAGVTGLIKVILGLQRREIPPNLHFKSGNPRIDWASMPVTVPTKVMPWHEIGGRRVAGVSSFGFSGTNAHVILEEAPSPKSDACSVPDRPLHLLALSARHQDSLLDIARKYESRLTDEMAAADVCFTGNSGRSHFKHRVAIVGEKAGDIRRGLKAYINSIPNPSVCAGSARAERPRIAFLFTGQGAQYAGMGRSLYDTSPIFRRTLDECAQEFAAHLDRGLLELMFPADPETIPIDETIYAQPVTFSIEVALAALWRSWGIEPDVVMGHSLGEYAAAHVAGMLPLGDAVRLVAERGRLTHNKMTNTGAMAAVLAPYKIVAAEIDRSAGALTVAAFNGPERHVISGPRVAIEAAVARLEKAGVEAKSLRISYAAHSGLIDPVLPLFKKVLETIEFQPARIPVVSNVSGSLGTDDMAHSQYWLSQMRAPVQFEKSISTLIEQGVTHFVELGPHPVLLGLGAECAPGANVEWLPSLRRDRADWCDLLESLQRLYVSGSDVDWVSFDKGYSRRRIALPTYSFRKIQHWTDLSPATPAGGQDRWSRVTKALERHADHGPLDVSAASYPAKLESLARLTSAHAIQILRQAGLFTVSGEKHQLEDVLSASGIGKAYRHLVRRWLDRLVAQGSLRIEGTSYIADVPLPDPDLSSHWTETERLFASNQSLFRYVRQCGLLLNPVLRGEESPLETLFPGGSFELAQELYEQSEPMRYVNALAANALAAIAVHIPEGRALRILEIGAGTGGTTSGLLSVLPPNQAQYLFTDVSDVFLDRARERFGKQYPFLTAGRFDLDKDLTAQGYLPNTFDVIASANAVHASCDLPLALRRLRDLLAPGGLLLLVESTTHFDWFDMTTGLIEGWQHFTDELRSDNPLLSPDEWVEALVAAGFEEAGAWPRPNSPAAHFGQHVVVARVAGRPEDAMGAKEFASRDAVSEMASMPGDPVKELFRQRVLDALPADRLDLIRDFVRERVIQVLRLDRAEPPDRNARLMDLGFDSLMAVQLRNLLTKDLGIERPLRATVMFDYPTINALATHLLDQLEPKEDPAGIQVAQATSVREPAVLGAAAVAAMSDAEIETRLLERLERR
jgi:acyl transferase domain-containing protein/SAM-dependent methyltransferase